MAFWQKPDKFLNFILYYTKFILKFTLVVSGGDKSFDMCKLEDCMVEKLNFACSIFRRTAQNAYSLHLSQSVLV